MQTHRIRRCAEPGCTAWGIRRHCEDHATDAERELRGRLDLAVMAYADTEDAYVAAVRADDPLAVVEALEPYRAASSRLLILEQGLGMVR